MSDVLVTVSGHVGQDPVLLTAESGTRWTSIRVASTRRVRDARTGEWSDGPTIWFTVRAFGDRALNLVDSVRKGTPVVVTGRLAFEEYEVRKQETGADGAAVEVRAPRTALVIENATVAVDLSRGVARYTRTGLSALPPGSPAQVASDSAAQGATDDEEDERSPGQAQDRAGERARETVGV